MKIEIDLKDILGDEYGDMESLAGSIERQLVNHLKDNLAAGIQKKIDSEVNVIISDKVKEAANNILPTLIEELVDKEYQVVDRYGDRKGSTTMRKELISTLTSQMVYKKCIYNRDKNFFTERIDEIVSGQMEEFKKMFDSKVDEEFTKEAFEYAIIKMKQKFKMAE